MLNKHSIGYYTFSLVFVLAIFSIGNWFERSQSLPMMLAFFSAFLCYIFLLLEKESFQVPFVIGIIARLSLFFSMPSLSDDIFRFLWDGNLLNSGIHPFAELPDHYLNQNIEGINIELFDRLNSPDYFTIYPPINQFIFWLSVVLGNSWLASTNIIRILLLAADIGSLYFLRRLLDQYKQSKNLAFWYFLNPLVILEFTGNVHFEGLVAFFLLVGIYFFEINRKVFSSLGFGLAIGTKLLPLIFLPSILLKEIQTKQWWITTLAALFGFLTLVPLLNESFIYGISTSLNLYFQTFEFNASLYYMAREIGFWIYGYNNIAQIGPLLSILSLLSILIISFIGFKRKWTIPKTFLFILTIYLLFATTVHPWYILPLIAFGLLSGYWFPIIWSFFIFMTYFGYSEAGFELPYWIVVLEYLMVLISFIIETRISKWKLSA